MRNPSDLEQMTGEVIQLGAIASVDPANATCTVAIGEITTGELPWLAQRAGGVRSWSPPTVGEQCVVLAPEGDLANGLVVLGLYSNAHPAPSTNSDLVQLALNDGAVIEYNQAAHALSATLPAGGTAQIEAPGGIAIKGNVAIEGDISLEGDISMSGTLTAEQDVLADGKSLKSHRHSGVTAGAAQSGPPA
ncbi:phage baseplate assembly protein V [Sphingobium sp. B11D3A]|nr:phage baseplate assembly protein V [Sphingobium sp. B11D3A]